MLLNPNDFAYEYFHQPRGKDGDSGPLYMGKPRFPGQRPILVKSSDPTDAINEFIGCNVGQRIGVNTPQAWLFKPCKADFDKICFGTAVAIEYLEGLDEKKGDLSDSEELAVQVIKCEFLHRLIFERDGLSYARVHEKVYAFDFAEGMLSQYIPSKDNSYRLENGFTPYRWMLMNWEHESRKQNMKYLTEMSNKGGYGDLAATVYMELREKFIELYNKDGFSDLVQDIKGAFTDYAAELAKEMIDAMQQSLVSF